MNLKRTAAGILAILMMMTIIPSISEEATAPAAVDLPTEQAAQPSEQAETPEEAPPAEAATAAEPAQEPAGSTDEIRQLTAISDTQRLDAAYTLALNAITTEDYETAKEYINICFAYCDAQSNPVMFSDLLLKRACIDVVEQKNEMALLNLDAAIRVKPDLADAYLVRTQVYAAMGDADKSIENLEKYIELTHDTAMYETVAHLQEAKGDIAAAQAAYDKYVQGAGAEVEEAGFQAGLYKMESGKFEEAIAAFEAYQDNETYAAGALYNIGVCKMNLSDLAGAVEAFTACAEKGGAFEGLYYNRGVCSLLNGDWSKAAEDFTKSIETEPYVDDARYNLAICQVQSGEFEKAIATFTEYIGKDTAADETERAVNYGAYYYRAMCLAEQGKLEDALADYTACIDHGFELGQSYYQRAQVYAALGNTEKQNADLAESLKYSE